MRKEIQSAGSWGKLKQINNNKTHTLKQKQQQKREVYGYFIKSRKMRHQEKL